MALGLLIPAMAYRMLDLGGNATVIGLIYALFSLASLLSAPLWGMVADRWGRKPVFLISSALTACSYLIVMQAEALWVMFAGRIMAGLSSGWLVAAQAFASDVSGPDKRAKAMGILGASFGMGFTLGALSQSFLVKHGWDFASVAATAGACSTLSLLVVLLWVREPKARESAAISWSAPIKLFRRYSELPVVLGLYFALWLVFNQVEGVMAVWLQWVTGLGSEHMGYVLALAGGVAFVVQGGVLGWLVRCFGERATVYASYGFMAAGLVVVMLSQTLEHMMAAIVLLSIAVSLHAPIMQAVISHIVPPQDRGGALGTAQSVQSCARILGPASAGLLFDGIAPVAPFVLGLMVLATTVWWLQRLPPRLEAPHRHDHR